MAKLNPVHGNWLLCMMSNLGVTRERAVPPATRMSVLDDDGSLGGLSRDVCALPELFARARSVEIEQAAGVHPESPGDVGGAIECVERERRAREAALEPIDKRLVACRLALRECRTLLTPLQRRPIDDALLTLETEYKRLRDAERYFFERKIRQIQHGEADDDPEFGIALERVMNAKDKGDGVAESVAHAVQTLAAVLVVCLEQQADGS